MIIVIFGIMIMINLPTSRQVEETLVVFSLP